jgi:Lon protease-like protein
MVFELPMFPLGSPAVPDAGLPLHVFEDRYRALMDQVMATDRRFGIVMIDRGSEVGGGERRTDVGVLVEVADAQQLDDGRWVLVAIGVGRVRVAEWLPDDPFPRAMVDRLDEQPYTGDPDVAVEIQARVRRIAGLLAELGDPAPEITVELDPDPAVAAWQAVAVTPIGALDTQRLLEMNDADRRIAATVEALESAEELLLLRIGG